MSHHPRSSRLAFSRRMPAVSVPRCRGRIVDCSPRVRLGSAAPLKLKLKVSNFTCTVQVCVTSS
jgi:hypothetical protein